jgi:putative PIN family toxin of toxin-antitoxin system
MIRAVLDTNVFVQGLIGEPRSASARVLASLTTGQFRIAFSLATLDELFEVLLLRDIRESHGLSPNEVARFINSVIDGADLYDEPPEASVRGVRDVTDRKFIALCMVHNADYLVTNDRRHLVRLRRHSQSRIVTPAAFLRTLASDVRQ